MSDIKKPIMGMVDEVDTIDQPTTKKKGGWGTKILVIIIVIVVILIGLYLVSKYTDWNVLNVNKTATVKTTGWQAVFLSNGQVYFGQIVNLSNDQLVLEEIYYLQVTQQIQPAPEGQQPQEAQQNLSLVKLGNELHGPKDKMQINMDHVLFTEELKADSSVVSAIKDYLEAPVE